MIVPAEIPQIPGDLEQLLGHAAGLRVTGPALAQTGSDVHSTWQGLVPHYTAPEAGNLFAATLPVRDVAVAVGEEITVIGRALANYADTVRPVQTRLRELRTEAAAFTTRLPADGSWESDPALVERDAALLGEVNALVAAWQEAQRVCASAISALYGGPAYRADDGDGVLGPGEFGFTAAQLDALSAAGQPLPWGTPVERDPGFLGDVLTAWHGFAVSGFWADVTGVGSLVGIGPDGGHDWALAGQAWGAIGKLTIIPYVDDVLRGEMNPLQAVGTVYGNWGSVLAGAIALDEWGENPMGALGQTIYNVGTLPLAILKAAKPAAAAGRVAGAGLHGVGRRVTDALDRIPTVDELVRQYAERLDIQPRLGALPAVVGDGPGGYRFGMENPSRGREAGEVSVPPTPFRSRIDGIVEHLQPRDLDAARRELAGEVVARKPDGTPWNHVQEVQDAQRGLVVVIERIRRRLGHVGLSAADRAVLLDDLARASRLLDHSENFVPR